MAKTNPSTILLMGDPMIKQREAGGTIMPGHFLELNSADKVVVQDTADNADALKWVAIENDIGGDDLDHAYLNGEVVRFAACRSGDEVYALLPASATAVVIGSLLTTVADGTVKLTSTEGDCIAKALEAVDNSGGSSVARVRIEIL